MKTFLFALVALMAATTLPAHAVTRDEALAAGARAMAGLDGMHKAWLTTLPPAQQQLVLCMQLAVDNDPDGLAALDCYTVNDTLTAAKKHALRESWARYQAVFGYAYPTGTDMARVAPQDRAAVGQAIHCRQVRDKIQIQMDLMIRGSSGYWNMDALRQIEQQQCADKLAVMP